MFSKDSCKTVSYLTHSSATSACCFTFTTWSLCLPPLPWIWVEPRTSLSIEYGGSNKMPPNCPGSPCFFPLGRQLPWKKCHFSTCVLSEAQPRGEALHHDISCEERVQGAGAVKTCEWKTVLKVYPSVCAAETNSLIQPFPNKYSTHKLWAK